MTILQLLSLLLFLTAIATIATITDNVASATTVIATTVPLMPTVLPVASHFSFATCHVNSIVNLTLFSYTIFLHYFLTIFSSQTITAQTLPLKQINYHHI